MNKTAKVFLSILLISVFLSLAPTNALAASASASASPSTVKPGGSVTVTIIFRGTDIGAVDGSFSYDPSILQFTGGSSTSVSGGKGLIKLVTFTPNSSSLTATMNFKALKEGNTTVSASSSLILSYHDEKSLGTASASTRITVKAPTTGTTNPAPSKPKDSSSSNTSTKPSKSNTQDEPEETPVNPVEEAIGVTLGDKTLYMWRDLSSIKLPEGFQSGEATYKIEKIQVAKGKDKDIALAYLTDKDGKNGGFFVLDKSDNLYPFITLNTASSYTILQQEDPEMLPEGYMETELKLDDKTVQAWQLKSGENPDFCLLYVMNADGESAFYLYDKAEKTMQRYVDQPVVLEPEPQTLIQKLSGDSTLLAVVGALGILSIILLIILIVLYVRNKQFSRRAKDILRNM